MGVDPIPFTYFLCIVYHTEDFTGIVIDHIMDQGLDLSPFRTLRHE